jgi:hypothetical protein
VSVESLELNQLPFGRFRSLFAGLPIPEPGSILGTYQAAFVGPGWLRTSAGPALDMSGLGGWWGKEFFADGSAINIVQRQGVFSRRFTMHIVVASSLVDKRQGLALHYQPGNPFPWMFVIDELRQLDATRLLGMTIANLPGLRGLAFPFVLQQVSNI